MNLKKKKQKFYFDLGTYSIKASSDRTEDIIYDSGLVNLIKGSHLSSNQDFAIDFKYSSVDELLEMKRVFKQGNVTDVNTAKEVIKRISEKLEFSHNSINTAIVAISPLFDQNYQKLLIKLFDSSGFTKVVFIKEAIALGLGALGRITKDSFCLIINIGYSKTSINLVSDRTVVISTQLDIGFDSMIKQFISNISVSESRDVSYLKAREFLGSYSDLIPAKDKQYEIFGKAIEGMDKFMLESEHIKSVTRGLVNKIIRRVNQLKLELDPALVESLSSNGVCITGGLASLANLSKYITKSLNIPCFTAEEPINSIISGLKYF